MTTLGSAMEKPGGNNLNAIRLCLALLVIVAHSFPLSLGASSSGWADHSGAWLMKWGPGTVAVNLFFLISGILITASWLRSRSMQDFLRRRILRIYPGFIVALLFSATVVWIFCPEFRQGVGRRIWGGHLFQDIVSLSFRSLRWPGTFGSNPFPGAANESLWTIQREFLCYLAVSAIGVLCLFQHRLLILFGTAVLYLFYARGILAGENLTSPNIRLFLFFFTGVNLWLWRDKIPFSLPLCVACATALLGAHLYPPAYTLLMPLLGGYALIGLAYGPVWSAMKWTDRTDLSYGVYLYAFPVQQVVAMAPDLRSPLLSLAVVVPVTLGLAWLSWKLVEKPFLSLKSVRFVDQDPALVPAKAA